MVQQHERTTGDLQQAQSRSDAFGKGIPTVKGQAPKGQAGLYSKHAAMHHSQCKSNYQYADKTIYHFNFNQ
jgi:hypothetical protein